MSAEKFLIKLKEALDLDPKVELTLQTEMSAIPFWDSLALVSVIAFLDTEYSVSLTVRDVAGMRTIADLYKVIPQGHV